MDEDGSVILGRALAHWAQYPPNDTEEQREVGAREFTQMIERICACHGLVIVPLGIATEIEADHQ